jgi:hypothetical protein
MAQSDNPLAPRVDGWVEKTIKNFQAGQTTFSDREIFEVDQYCYKLSENFQIPEPVYQAFVRDRAYPYATDATKQSLPEELLKERSDPGVVKRQLKTLIDDGALEKLRIAVNANQKKIHEPRYADALPKVASQDWGMLRGGNRMLPSFKSIPSTGECNKFGQAKPAKLLPSKLNRTTTLTPAGIRRIMVGGLTDLTRTHDEVFYAAGAHKGCLKPAYIWTALEKDNMGKMYLSDAVLDKHCPLWRIILACGGNLKAFDDGSPSVYIPTSQNPSPMIKSEDTALKGEGGEEPLELTALVQKMFLEFKEKEARDKDREMKEPTFSTTEVSSELSTKDRESADTNETSADQSCEEENSDEAMNSNLQSRAHFPTNEQNGDDANLDADLGAAEEARDTGMDNGSSIPLSSDERAANTADSGNTPLSQTQDVELVENSAPEEMTPNTAPNTDLAVKTSPNKRSNEGSPQPPRKRTCGSGRDKRAKNSTNEQQS